MLTKHSDLLSEFLFALFFIADARIFAQIFAIISIMTMMESLIVLDNEPQKELYLLLIGAVLAFMTSFFRLCKVKKNFFVKLSDSLICSLISLSTYFLIKQFHPIDPEFAIAIGSWIGYLGVDGIKTILLDRWGNK